MTIPTGNPGQGFILPDAIMRDRNLRGGDVKILTRLSHLCMQYAHPMVGCITQARLAEFTGLSREWVCKSLHRLEALGYLIIKRYLGQGRPNRYWVRPEILKLYVRLTRDWKKYGAQVKEWWRHFGVKSNSGSKQLRLLPKEEEERLTTRKEEFTPMEHARNRERLALLARSIGRHMG